jgi:hypothetical protein
VSLNAGSGIRKAPAFYTPQPIAAYLIRRSSPVRARRNAGQILNLKVLDPSMGSGVPRPSVRLSQ